MTTTDTISGTKPELKPLDEKLFDLRVHIASYYRVFREVYSVQILYSSLPRFPLTVTMEVPKQLRLLSD